MTRIKFSLKSLTLVFVLMFCTGNAIAQGKYAVIYTFTGGNDGAKPMAALVADKAGNLYGTAHAGGSANWGTVFELTPPARGQNTWNETTIYTFQGGADGFGPVGGLILDAQGNLYGTTADNVAYNGCAHACGTVFRLSPPTSGSVWTKTVLYRFNGLKSGDGANPYGTLVLDTAGNLYGTTYAGGSACLAYIPAGCGTIFELSPSQGGGTWTEIQLFVFSNMGANGVQPEAGLAFDQAGNLYGTTYMNGFNSGDVFQLTPPAGGGAWTYNVIHGFGRNSPFDGAWPVAGVVVDPHGNVYGTTSVGGANENCYLNDGSPQTCGTVFRLTPPKQGMNWGEQLIYQFQNNGDGATPYGGLTADSHGNLYTTTTGIYAPDFGTVVKLSRPLHGGVLTEKTLHRFASRSDGAYPYSGVVVVNNALYGTTTQGGTGNCRPRGCGTVYEIAP